LAVCGERAGDRAGTDVVRGMPFGSENERQKRPDIDGYCALTHEVELRANIIGCGGAADATISRPTVPTHVR
jgi:hypothetical protein